MTIDHMKQQRIRSVAGTPLRVVGSVMLVTQMEQEISDTGFLVVENLAINILLGTKFIGENVERNAPGKKLIHPVGSRIAPITLPKNILVAQCIPASGIFGRNPTRAMRLV